LSWRKVFLEHLGPGGLTGASFGDWIDVLRDNRFAVGAEYWPRAALISGNCLLNSLVRRWEDMRYGAQIASTEVHPPLFVLGVWRSGTTHLHNLLARDDRFAYPNTYEVFYPHTFLTTQATGRRFMQWMMPATRPMDNVKSGVEEPQEDEFALVASGLSFMLGLVIFPRSRNVYQKYLTLTHALPPERERWKSAFLRFLRKLTLKYNRPLILKSPAHTGRLDVLLEMFPTAKFVHIHRDPYTVFQSTVHTWRKVKSFWGLQSDDVDDERVIDNYVQVYDAFFAERHRLTDQNYCEVRFDDLVRDPLGQLRHVYQRLSLPTFDYVEPAVHEYIHSIKGYSRNSFEPMTDPIRERVRYAWSRSFEEWGYAR
jgi:omega-hydroxy-beta-dihydromenaquinone-9 sulfotransferase